MGAQYLAAYSDTFNSPAPSPPAGRRVRELLAKTQAHSDRVLALNEIALALGGGQTVDDLLRVVGARVGQLLKFEHFGICLSQDGLWHLRTLSGAPLSTDRPGENDALRRVLTSAQSELVADGPITALPNGYRSLLIAPLVSDHEVLGAIQFGTVRPGAYTTEDQRVANLLAAHLAANMHNVRRLETLQAAQASLARYTSDLEERNRDLDAFSHTVAHDLKAPLGQINGYAHLLNTRPSDHLDGEAYEFLDQIQSSVITMSRMIDQLLFMAQLRATDDVLGAVAMNPVVDLALERFRKTIDDSRISVEIMPELPDACGHEIWLEEVFANLIGNAIKYMGANNPAPCISISGALQGDHVRYDVCDNGIGIAPADRVRLFQMFSRVNVGQIEGLGLGLAIVRRIVQRLGGDVGVESSSSGGSSFWFTLRAHCKT